MKNWRLNKLDQVVQVSESAFAYNQRKDQMKPILLQSYRFCTPMLQHLAQESFFFFPENIFVLQAFIPAQKRKHLRVQSIFFFPSRRSCRWYNRYFFPLCSENTMLLHVALDASTRTVKNAWIIGGDQWPALHCNILQCCSAADHYADRCNAWSHQQLNTTGSDGPSGLSQNSDCNSNHQQHSHSHSHGVLD